MAKFPSLFLNIIIITIFLTPKTASASSSSSTTTPTTSVALAPSLSEAKTLLKFKSSLKDPLNILSNWSSTSSLHHCNWTGVECTSTGGDSGDPLSQPFVASINLQSKNLSGEISSSICLLPYLTTLVLEDNQFKIPFPDSILKCKSLTILRLGKNQIYGGIPDGVSQLSALKKFDLHRNRIEGKIPPSLGNITGLRYLDLSCNSLTSSIPEELEELNLCVFDVSFNQLTGRVPLSLVVHTCASFFQGNKGLCGFGLPGSCLAIDPLLLEVAITILVLSICFDCAVLRYALVQEFKTKIPKNAWRSQFFHPLKLTTNELVTGMNEKNARGAGSSFGRYHVVSTPSDGRVAVKKLGSSPAKSLNGNIKKFAKIKHTNVAKILGLWYSDKEVYIIHKYALQGSLGDLISKPGFQLSWAARLKIAIGIAKGLKYLHTVPRILHRNLKSNNILLDEKYQPMLTDYALDLIVDQVAFQASSCYIAPEAKKGGNKATEKMDIYSFGVVLLELITGKQAETTIGSEASLVITNERSIQVLDPNISESCCFKQEMSGALEIALRCTSIMPEERLSSMSEVVKELQALSASA